MKILLLNDTSVSSPGNIVNMIARGYENEGHTVSLLTDLPISYRKSLRHYHCIYSPKVSTMIAKEFERIRPDVVHIHNVHQNLTYDTFRIAHQFTSRVFMTMHDVFSFAFGRLNSSRYLNSLGKDVYLTPMDHWENAGLEYNPLRNAWIRHMLRTHAKKIIAVSQALQKALHRHHIKNVSVIHNGINVDEWECSKNEIDAFRETFDLHSRKIILFGGRVSKDKGTEPLRAMIKKIKKDVPEVLLLVVGDKKRWGNNDAHTRCIGWLDRKDMRLAMQVADIVTVPSLCLDCFPQINLEAMAAGKPVIGTVFGGTSEVVIDGVTGFILDPRDIDTYVEKTKLLLQNSTLCKRMGEAGKKRVVEKFSVKKQVKEYLSMFRN